MFYFSHFKVDCMNELKLYILFKIAVLQLRIYNCYTNKVKSFHLLSC